MNDKELLMMAAKAAGYDKFGFNSEQISESGWEPLTDDGDAFRLAVKLELDISILCYCSRAFVHGLDFEEIHNGDPYAATRRAIVRAAAEIGRKL